MEHMPSRLMTFFLPFVTAPKIRLPMPAMLPMADEMHSSHLSDFKVTSLGKLPKLNNVILGKPISLYLGTSESFYS